MITAKEYWKKRFGEYPQTDADKLACVMMVEYATECVHEITCEVEKEVKDTTHEK